MTCQRSPIRLASALFGALLWLAAGAAHAALTLEANGQAGTVQVQPGEQVDLEVIATGCPGSADRWRDNWADPDGIGVPPPAQEVFTASVCARGPTRSFIAPNSPGSSFDVTFTAESCRNGRIFIFVIPCPTNLFGGTAYQVFDSDTVTIEVIADDVGVCVADFAVYAGAGLAVDDDVSVNGNAVSGNGNVIDADTGNRSVVSLPLPGFSPASFPSFSGPQVQRPPDGPVFAAGDYDRIRLNPNQNATLDTSNGNDFRINDLILRDGATVNLGPGRYFIDTLSLGEDAVLNVSSGTAEIYIGSELIAEQDASINAGGSVGDLIVRLYDNVEVGFEEDVTFVGILYGPGSGIEIEADDEVQITGSIVTGGSVALGEDTVLIYSPAAEAIVGSLAPCDVGTVDHYTISHAGTAVTCGETAITITARDSGGNPVDPGNASIDLVTSTGEGTWARVLSGSGVLSGVGTGAGTASYTFPDNGETAVTLAFNYTTVSAITDPELVNFSVNAGEELPIGGQQLVVSLAGFRITDGGGNAAVIPEQIAGKPSDQLPGAASLALQAIRASDSDPSQCVPYFPDGGDVVVEIGAECIDPDSCAGNALQLSNNASTSAVATSDDNGTNGAAAYTPLSLRFGADAQAPVVLRYDDAGRIQLHLRYNPIDDTTPTPPVVNYVIGSSNAWVTRPFGLHVAVAGDDATTGASGTVLAVAGDDVDASVRAVVWQSGDDGDDDGQPDAGADLTDNGTTPNFGNEAVAETVTLTPVVAAPVGGSNGALGGALFAGFSAGSRTQGVSWDEVGHVHLDARLTDLSYLGGGDVTGRGESAGRFIPADFALAVASHGDLDAACGTTFTYTGQPAGYFTAMAPVLTITARNRAAATTSNYRDSYAKLTASGITVAGPVQDSAAIGLEGDPIAVTSNLDTGVLVANGDGTLSHTFASTDRFTVDKVHNARIDPFVPQLQLDVTALSDGEAAADPAFLPLAVQPAAIHDIRFGRLAIDAASGSELVPLEQPLRAQFWSNATWQTNVADDCTTLTLGGEVSMDNDQDGPVPGTAPIQVGSGSTELTTDTTDPLALVSGVAVLGFAAPGEGNTGWVDTTLTLDAALPWLRDDWDDVDGASDGPYDGLPVGRATFGIFTGNPAWIHFRRVQ